MKTSFTIPKAANFWKLRSIERTESGWATQVSEARLARALQDARRDYPDVTFETALEPPGTQTYARGSPNEKIAITLQKWGLALLRAARRG